MAGDVLELVFNGLLVGSVFALGGVGLTLVYGILRLANFAHGDLLTTGAFIGWVVVAGTFSIAPWIVPTGLAVAIVGALLFDLGHRRRLQRADQGVLIVTLVVLAGITFLVRRGTSEALLIGSGLVIAAAGTALLAVGLDRTLWRKLRRERANILTLMIVSIGVAFALRSLVQIIFGGRLRVFFPRAQGPNPAVNDALGRLGIDLRITNIDLWVFGTAALAVLVTHFVLAHTRTGKAMRALSDNRDLALVSGIDTERVVGHVWVLGGALAGIAGALLAMLTSLHVNLGWDQLLSIFAAVILGGIGSATGALLGGLSIGVAQELSTLVIPAEYKLAVGFAILIVTLLVRPQGILGVRD